MAYRAASTYYDIDANATFQLYIGGSGTSSLNIATAAQAGKIYTVYISGNTLNTLSYHVIAQN